MDTKVQNARDDKYADFLKAMDDEVKATIGVGIGTLKTESADKAWSMMPRNEVVQMAHGPKVMAEKFVAALKSLG